MSILAKVAKGVLITAAFLSGVHAGTASASDPCSTGEVKEKSVEETVDGWFGDFVVSPMAAFMFYDLVFWDNHYPMGHMDSPPDTTGLTEDKAAAAMQAYRDAALSANGASIRAFDDSAGVYVYGCRVPTTRDAVRPVLEDNAVRNYGPLTATLYAQEDVLMAKVDSQPLEWQKFVPEPTEDQVELDIQIEGVPFPITVSTETGMTKEIAVPIDWESIAVAPGSFVQFGEGDQVAEVAAMHRRTLNLWTDTTWVSGEPLEKPASEQIMLPAVVFWLVLGAFFFTLRFSFVNIRALRHAVEVTAGKFDDHDEPGEVTHFQALSSALSATVGLGNIAGVAIAVTMGGAGAIFWMIVAGFLGMSSKFAECTLGQMYRTVRADGSVSGGPMHYLSDGLKEMGLGAGGKVLAILFALMCIGGSLGGGNMFQGNQSFQAIADLPPLQEYLMPSAEGEVQFERRRGVTETILLPKGTEVSSDKAVFAILEDAVIPEGSATSTLVPVRAVHAKTKGWNGNVAPGDISSVSRDGDLVTVANQAATSGGSSQGIWFGLLMMAAVGLVIIGGIKRIGAAASIIVPAMCGLYVLACIYILIVNAALVPEAFATIFSEALTPEAGFGGVVGALITGFRRASFSNEAGVGSASIAHSAAATSEPVREGIVALLEPFIDTIIVCTMTGLVIVTTQNMLGDTSGVSGISLTSQAFEVGGHWTFPWVLALAVTLFAFSTMISWSYYGERAATWLLGDGARVPYKVLFLLCAALGPVFTLGNVLTFSDLMVLGMAFPNILGVVLLSNKVAAALKAYMGKLQSGEFQKSA